MDNIVPNLLVLEIKFNISEDILSKNTFISLDIEKLKLEEINKKRESNSKQLIEYGDIEKFLKRVSVNKENLEIVVLENKDGIDDPDVIEDIKSLFLVSKKSIQYEMLNNKIFLHHDESHKQHLEENNEMIFEDSFKTIQYNNIIRTIGIDNFNDIKEKKSRYTPLFNTITNENIKLLKNAFNDLKDTDSYKFVNEDKLMIYIPDNSLIEVPTNIYGEVIDYESVDVTLRYPNEEEYINNSIHNSIHNSLKESINSFNNILENKILYKYTVESDDNWTKDNVINHNSSKINISLYPRIVLDDDNNLTTSKPVEKKEYYLRLFYGINKKLLDGSSLEDSVFNLSV